jgi:hypothetical protein
VEHLADSDIRAELIPVWVKPDMFEDMQFEFMKRREWEGIGKAQKLFDEYNRINGTAFTLDHDWLIEKIRFKRFNKDRSKMFIIEPLEDGSYSLEIFSRKEEQTQESEIEADEFGEPLSYFVTESTRRAFEIAREELGTKWFYI